jgi:nudix-type nucleoside diphosphatase (YffH/AdpP family)
MKDYFKQISKTVLADRWCRLYEYVFELKRRDGTWQKMSREVYARGPVVTCLLHNPKTDNVLLIRQFRLPCALNGRDPMIIETPAGMLDGIDPADRMRAELEEEAGFRVTKLEQIYDLMMSPGCLSEGLVFFTGTYDESNRVSDGGGLHHEGEDIEVLEIPFDEAYAMIKTGEICDAKTVLLLQHHALAHR